MSMTFHIQEMDDNTIISKLLKSGMVYDPKAEQLEIIKYLMEGKNY